MFKSLINKIKKFKFSLKNIVIILLVAFLVLVVINFIFLGNTIFVDMNDVRNIPLEQIKDRIEQVSESEYTLGRNSIVKYPSGRVTYRTYGYSPSTEEVAAVADAMGVAIEDVVIYEEVFVERELYSNPSEQLDRDLLEDEREQNEGGDAEDKDF